MQIVKAALITREIMQIVKATSITRTEIILIRKCRNPEW